MMVKYLVSVSQEFAPGKRFIEGVLFLINSGQVV